MTISCEMIFGIYEVTPRDPMERAVWFEKHKNVPKHFTVRMEAPHTAWAQTEMYTLEGTVHVASDYLLKNRLKEYGIKCLQENPVGQIRVIDVTSVINEHVQERAALAEARRQKEKEDNLEHARLVNRIGQLSFDDVLGPTGGWTPSGVNTGLDFSPKVLDDERLATYLTNNYGFMEEHLQRFDAERKRRREAARLNYEGNLARLAAEVRKWVQDNAKDLPSNIVRAAASGRDVTKEVLKYCCTRAVAGLRGYLPEHCDVLLAPQDFDANCSQIPTQFAYSVLDAVLKPDWMLSVLLPPGAKLHCTESDFGFIDTGDSRHQWRNCLHVCIDHPWDYHYKQLSFYVLLTH